MVITHFIYGLIAVIVGVVTLKYNYQIVNNTSRLEFIESKLGSGSTYLVYKLFSVILVLGGILFMVGLGDNTLTWLFSPLAHLFPQTGN